MSTMVRVGAGWLKEGKDGRAYISLSLDMKKITELAEGKADENFRCLLFENTKKEKEKQPDYNLVIFKD